MKTNWYKLKNEYDASIVERIDANIVVIKIDNALYHYSFQPSLIKEIDGEWTGKLITFLKTRHCRVFRPIKEEDIKPIREIVERKEPTRIWFPTDMAPGKYKDLTWNEVSIEDVDYVKWMIKSTKDINLKSMLIGLIYLNGSDVTKTLSVYRSPNQN